MRTATLIVRENIDVNRRLTELSMNRSAVLAIRDVACSMAATGASPFFPSNGAGTLAYQFGTRELRAQLDPFGWVIDRSFGTQGARLPDQKLVALYKNVDVACSLIDLPRARSRMGAGSQRLSQGSMFEGLEDQVSSTYDLERSGIAVWWIMVAESGAVEVTQATVEAGEFSNIVERIWVSDGSDWNDSVRSDQSDTGDAVEFDVIVTRR